jgi:elongator complex protein 6
LSGLFIPGTRNQKGVITNSGLDSVFEAVKSEILALKVQSRSKVLVVIDQLDLLLAAGGDEINAVKLGQMVMGLQEVSSLQVFKLHADEK